MRIAFFLDGPILPISTGAAERFINLLRFQNSENSKTFLFKCYRDWSDDVELFKKEEFTTFFLKPDVYFNDSELIVDMLSANKINFCYFSNPETLFKIGLKLKEKGFPIIYDCHDIYSIIDKRLGLGQEKQDISDFTQFVAATYADLVYICSETDKQYLVHLGIQSNKIYILPNCTNTKEITYNLPDSEKKNILFVGHNFYQPNLNAIKILRNQIYDSPLLKDFTFNICGLTPIESIDELQAGRFIFHGFVENLATFYSESSIAVAPIFEGSGTRVKILQYLAAGIPTITTTIGIEGLDLKNNQDIIICDDIKLYPELINNLVSNKVLYQSLSIKGRNAIENKYDWKITLTQVNDWINRNSVQ